MFIEPDEEKLTPPEDSIEFTLYNYSNDVIFTHHESHWTVYRLEDGEWSDEYVGISDSPDRNHAIPPNTYYRGELSLEPELHAFGLPAQGGKLGGTNPKPPEPGIYAFSYTSTTASFAFEVEE